jgi:hypothetical protein
METSRSLVGEGDLGLTGEVEGVETVVGAIAGGDVSTGGGAWRRPVMAAGWWQHQAVLPEDTDVEWWELPEGTLGEMGAELW